MSAPPPTTHDLLEFIAASPTPKHCCAEVITRLEQRGFKPLSMGQAWDLEIGAGYYVVRGGALVGFVVGEMPAAEAGFRLIGAHTDSPNLRIKPIADVHNKGYRQLGVEVYGGALTYTWLDRDLGLAGEVMLRGEGSAEITTKLLRIDEPIARIPSLAIHLNRD
ncbi:MAG: M18 family aminopeptidase, partial [Myxococcota bacterium]